MVDMATALLYEKVLLVTQLLSTVQLRPSSSKFVAHLHHKRKSRHPPNTSKTVSLYKNRSATKKKIAAQSKKRPKNFKKIKPDVKKKSMKLTEVPELTALSDTKDTPCTDDDDDDDGQKGSESFDSPHFEKPSKSHEDDNDLIPEIPSQITKENADCSTTSQSENCDLEKNIQPGEGICDKAADVDSSAQSIPSCCHICKKEMDSSAALSLHLRRQHNISNSEHKCLVCNKILSSASSLDRHMLVHSGERPFKCKLCDMAFTTNGNMHRHMRTHGESGDSSDTTKPNETKKKDLKRKSPSDDTSSRMSPLKPDDGHTACEDDEKLHCPVCGKSFLCKYGLQSHMETHPNDPILCQECGEISSNYTVHTNHNCNVQGTKQAPSGDSQSVPRGFHDVTFLDFSAQKFSLVSKHFCENNIKRPSSAFHVFECSKCDKAFPCGRALNLHKNVHDNKIGTFCPSCHCDFENSNFLQSHQLKHRCPEHCLSKNNSSDDVISQLRLLASGQQSHAGKEDFLALLQLQTKQTQLSFLRGLESCQITEENFENLDYFVYGKRKSGPSKSDVEGSNDFADIQSIISLTSKAPLISAVQSSSTALCPTSPSPASPTLAPQSPQIAESANASPEIPSKSEAVVTKHSKMENNENITVSSCIYSCKVCCQKFKSINALKRHSRLHVQRGSSYSCHLCSYVSVDKSTLIRHLRTHNGERPFQCVICKYAFTTKANCERHVRKRHKKLTKVEIRNSMQYNPNMSLKVADIAAADIGNNETVCKYCNVDFRFNRVLRHHLRSLHNSCNRKPFTCKICKFGFSTKNNCIRHVLKQHPDMKDKLKSVVIPNSQLENLNNRTVCSVDTKQRCYEKCDVQSGISALNSIPVDLSNKNGMMESRSETSHDKSSSADVIAAESLVSLSEAIPMQNKPLDLTAKPLDLSYKSLIPVVQKGDSKPVSIYSISSYSSTDRDNFLDLTTSERSECIHNTVVINQNIVSANFPENTSPKFGDSAEHSVQKLRAFTCLYCSAGFTLKSNMERHIKRKHPEFARPTRSRNFIPSVTVPGPQKQNMATLSNKTRDALRNVLNNKVQSLPVQQTQNVIQSVKNKDSSYCTNQVGIISIDIDSKPCSNEVNRFAHSLDLSMSSQKYNENMAQVSPRCISEQNIDDNSLDLASVSAVICTANSEQLKRYFEKSPLIDKGSGHDSETSESKDANEILDISSSGSCVCCPFCSRKFPWTSSLRRHILTHTGQKPYKCPLCSLWFTTKSNCERHLVSKHGQRGDLITRTVPERPFKCNQCPTSTFSTQGNLRKHFYLKHWTKSCMGMNTKPVNSENSCDKEMLDKTDCSDQSLAKSPSNLSTADKGFGHIPSEEDGPPSMIPCHFCVESFINISDLASHMHKHSNVIYMCYLCRKTFPKHGACLNHFKTSHSLVYSQIAQCDANFRLPVTQNNVYCNDNDSESSDTNISAMACVVCFQKILSVDDLQQHVKNHVQKEKSSNDVENHSILLLPDDVKEAEAKTSGPVNKRDSSLLFLFPSADDKPSCGLKQNEHFGSMKGIKANRQDEDSDLIQNLLGIHDSKMIDEMLDSADSAARLLGVKEV